MNLTILIVTMIAGLGAGIATGLAGLSAAAVITPMLVTLLGFNAYEAVGISLASDVLASAVSAFTYYKHKNLDIRNGLIMMISTVIFTMVGSWLGSLVPQTTLGSFSVWITMILGIRFIVKPVMSASPKNQTRTAKQKALLSLACG
ncbi:MAG: sulfite exporter TauE/SafE family protein, partial [Holdemania filiformis]